MAITTLNQVLSGMQPLQVCNKVASGTLVVGRPHSYWGLAGSPGAGAYDTTTTGVARSQTSVLVPGAIPYYDPPGGQNGYLARWQAVVTGAAGTLMLLDRLWENGGLTTNSTGLQSFSSAAFPNRDNTGTSNGVGVYLALEVSATTGINAPTITVTYTNSSGIGSHTAGFIDAAVASSIAGAFYRIGLQAGDYGVQSVQSLQFGGTAWASGTVNMVAYRVLAVMEVPSQFIPNAIDAVTGGFPQLFNGVTPFLVYIPSAVTATSIGSQFIAAQG